MERLGRYRIVKRLNKGGMTEILLVVGEEEEHRAARVLLDPFCEDKTYLRRFRRGGEILAQLDHPNIVRFYESGKEEGRPFQILEYIPGRSLRQLLLARDPALHDLRARVLLGLAAAVEHVHDRGFLHLDLKPENVMITPGGAPKLIDFDLAVPRSQARALRRVAGTPTYLAPEQIDRKRPDERTDIYVFGLIAYELLAGRTAATGATIQEILARRRAAQDRIPPLTPAEHDVSPALSRIVRGCLENDPARRYSSMTLVRHDLQKVFS